MSTVILSCSQLRDFVDAAQAARGTSYEVVTVDKAHHTEPDDMKRVVRETIDTLPPDVDTVLVAMGFCGGTWDSVEFSRRVVIPRVDDCVSMVLQRGDAYAPNLKEPGRMYLMSADAGDLALEVKCDLAQYPGLSEEDLFHMYFDPYKNLDIVDTGLTDCYSEEYVARAQELADAIDAELGYVEGANLLLEKLVAGIWDAQFLVAEPGHTLRHADFFE